MKKILNKVLANTTAFLLVVMTALVMWQVITRYALNSPSTFTEELVRIILIWTSLLGAAYAFGTREHMALIFLKEGTKGKAHKALCIFIDTMVLVFACIIMIYGGYRVAHSAIGIHTPILQIPKSIVFSIAPISGVLIVIQQIFNIYEDITMES